MADSISNRNDLKRDASTSFVSNDAKFCPTQFLFPRENGKYNSFNFMASGLSGFHLSGINLSGS